MFTLRVVSLSVDRPRRRAHNARWFRSARESLLCSNRYLCAAVSSTCHVHSWIYLIALQPPTSRFYPFFQLYLIALSLSFRLPTLKPHNLISLATAITLHIYLYTLIYPYINMFSILLTCYISTEDGTKWGESKVCTWVISWVFQHDCILYTYIFVYI